MELLAHRRLLLIASPALHACNCSLPTVVFCCAQSNCSWCKYSNHTNPSTFEGFNRYPTASSLILHIQTQFHNNLSLFIKKFRSDL